MRVAIITVSDAAAEGAREDLTGPALREMLQAAGAEVVGLEVVADEQARISAALRKLCDKGEVDIVLTNGGTGMGPRDVTPEATEEIIERRVPGLPEAMRIRTLSATIYAMLSRAVAGVRGNTLILNLPGSPRGAKECLEVVLPVLNHATELLRGEAKECAGRLHRRSAPKTVD
ncbi:MAG: molybdenum cofactor biosynthesis protein [Armatimonadetes bacterium]|nr:molybdenum cofactor biosynthesis protein [Armatimonadota bacterium]NIM24289.1 molybdenum cofactor biosynthesis protein [Armatimonadota bacterium]NIM68158.1 molybdenum cofactor biosynthesis protein [Armatimonadota bacterium]NIM76618.1 molybdenum cofactor biosynthesis protein [Armatimonadota bacterium]NIN06363.1 molybdenum cofactor biosynthesis protein [Armatimonadota bacterium]